MTFSRDSVVDPQGAARRLIGYGLPDSVRWIGFALACVLPTLLVQITILALPSDTPADPAQGAPIAVATLLFLGISMLVTTGFVHLVGMAFGGRGKFRDALLLVVWLQCVMIAPLFIVSVLQLVAPDVAGLLTLVLFAVQMWMMTHFIVALHGFQSAWRVFFGMVGVALATSVLLAALLGPALMTVAV